MKPMNAITYPPGQSPHPQASQVTTITLPYPPTGNHAVRHGKNGLHYIPSKVKEYRQAVWAAIKVAGSRNSGKFEPDWLDSLSVSIIFE
ncbi:hypothetical protein CCP4SC76_2160012 [Gammaproteobacteria bacterium]